MTSANQTAGIRPPANTIVGLILIVAFVIAALAFIDSALEKIERRDLENQARQAHVEGDRLVKQGKVNQAIEPLRKAHIWERSNTLYELDLIDALIAAKKAEDAQPLMNDILLREPDDGRANLSAARLMLQQGKPADAISYYHRAIYGDWTENAPAHRVAARMELVHLLVAEGRGKELLAELLNLQVEAGANMPIQKALGHLFLVAGSPSRAAAAYQAMIDHNPKDADAHAGMGETELEQGHTGTRVPLSSKHCATNRKTPPSGANWTYRTPLRNSTPHRAGSRPWKSIAAAFTFFNWLTTTSTPVSRNIRARRRRRQRNCFPPRTMRLRTNLRRMPRMSYRRAFSESLKRLGKPGSPRAARAFRPKRNHCV